MVRHAYDHEITIGADTKTLVLARDAKGAPMYSVAEETASPQLLAYIQQDWQGGFGQLNWEDPSRYAEGESIDTTWPGVVFCGPALNATTGLTAAPKKFMWFDAISRAMCITAQAVWWLNGTAWVSKLSLAAGELAEDLVEYKGILYVGISALSGAVAKYYYSADGASYTRTDLSDGFAERFIVAPNAAGTAEVLWKVKPAATATTLPFGTNQISQTTDGRTVAAGGVQWASANSIGDTSSVITKLVLLQGNLLVGKTDGWYLFDSAGATRLLMPEQKLVRGNALNWFISANAHGNLYAMLGGQVWEISSLTSYLNIDPFQQTKGIDIAYTARGLAADFYGNLYAIYQLDAANLEIAIYKGTVSASRWTWCPWARWTLGSAVDPVGSLTVIAHSATDIRLWFGRGTVAYYIKLILGYNPLTSTLDVVSGGYLRTSYFTAPTRHWQKFLLSLVTETEACTTARKITPKYRKDTETSFTAAAAAITTNGIVQTYLTAALNFKRIQFQLDFATDAATATPVLRHFELRGMAMPEVVRIYEATYHIGQSRSLRAKTIRDFLRTGRTTTSLIKFADLRHNETTLTGTAYHYVVMLPGYPQEVEFIHEKDADPDMGIRCRFAEVDFPEA